ncbi:hypothetical protein ACOMHN_018044 [Nucella lapillus]
MSDVTFHQATGFSPLNQFTGSSQQYPVSSASAEVREGIEELMSADVYWRAFPVMDQVLYVLEAIGLVLNVINIVVMTRPSMRSPTSTFLVALCVLQLVYIFISLIPAIHRIFKPLEFTDAFYLINSIYIINYGLSCLRRSMYCFQIFISAERLLAVWLPLKAKQFLLVRRPWLFILTTPVIMFFAHIYYPLRLEVFETKNSNNQTIHSFRYTDHYRQHSELFNALGIVTKALFVYLALLVLIVLNLAMIAVIRRSSSLRTKMSTNVDVDAAQKRENQMTLTIVVSTVIFVVLCLPTVTSSLAANAAPHSYGPFTLQRYLFLFMNKFGGLLFVLAFSTDFFTYVSLSTAYRDTLLRMLKLKRQKDTLASLDVGAKSESSAWS